MEIIDRRKSSVKFETVKQGEVFEFNGYFYMKTSSSYCDDSGDYDNVVNLESGELIYFEDNDIIMPVNCKLVIE